MSIIINAKGTSVPYFTIGKNGTTVYQGSTDPSNVYSLKHGDAWFNTADNLLEFWSSANTAWAIPRLADISFSGSTIAPISATDLILGTSAANKVVLSAGTGNPSLTSSVGKDLYISESIGGALFLNDIRWPSVSGTTGQLLTSDDTGNLVWSSISSGEGIDVVSGVISNTGVTSVQAGRGISLSGQTGEVIVSAAAGTVLQTVHGSVLQTSTSAVIPYDNTVPLITEGTAIWSVEFTPISSSSTIIITTSSFYTVDSSSSIVGSLAYFADSVNICSQAAGSTNNSATIESFNIIGSHSAGSVTSRTYTCRMGPSDSATMYIAQGTSGQGFGSTTNSGRYVIQEIAN